MKSLKRTVAPLLLGALTVGTILPMDQNPGDATSSGWSGVRDAVVNSYLVQLAIEHKGVSIAAASGLAATSVAGYLWKRSRNQQQAQSSNTTQEDATKEKKVVQSNATEADNNVTSIDLVSLRQELEALHQNRLQRAIQRVKDGFSWAGRKAADKKYWLLGGLGLGTAGYFASKSYGVLPDWCPSAGDLAGGMSSFGNSCYNCIPEQNRKVIATEAGIAATAALLSGAAYYKGVGPRTVYNKTKAGVSKGASKLWQNKKPLIAVGASGLVSAAAIKGLNGRLPSWSPSARIVGMSVAGVGAAGTVIYNVFFSKSDLEKTARALTKDQAIGKIEAIKAAFIAIATETDKIVRNIQQDEQFYEQSTSTISPLVKKIKDAQENIKKQLELAKIEDTTEKQAQNAFIESSKQPTVAEAALVKLRELKELFDKRNLNKADAIKHIERIYQNVHDKAQKVANQVKTAQDKLKVDRALTELVVHAIKQIESVQARCAAILKKVQAEATTDRQAQCACIIADKHMKSMEEVEQALEQLFTADKEELLTPTSATPGQDDNTAGTSAPASTTTVTTDDDQSAEQARAIVEERKKREEAARKKATEEARKREEAARKKALEEEARLKERKEAADRQQRRQQEKQQQQQLEEQKKQNEQLTQTAETIIKRNQERINRAKAEREREQEELDRIRRERKAEEARLQQLKEEQARHDGNDRKNELEEVSTDQQPSTSSQQQETEEARRKREAEEAATADAIRVAEEAERREREQEEARQTADAIRVAEEAEKAERRERDTIAPQPGPSSQTAEEASLQLARRIKQEQEDEELARRLQNGQGGGADRSQRLRTTRTMNDEALARALQQEWNNQPVRRRRG